MKKAFSLIELLISLIIISLITSALVPMLTRKLRRTDISLSSKTVSTDCTKLDNDNRCMMCTKTTCTLCITQTSTPEGYYVNPEESCDYKECKDKFVGCKACNKDFCVTCNEGLAILKKIKLV